jgi:serine/threonine-protein kinase HipA
MSDAIEVHIQIEGQTHLVGMCRYIAKRRGQSSLFEYADTWLDNPNAFSIDPANLPHQAGGFPKTSAKSALPGALRD